MGSSARYILTRVLIGLAIGIGMFYFRSAHAHTCPVNNTHSIKISSCTGGIGSCPVGQSVDGSVGALTAVLDTYAPIGGESINGTSPTLYCGPLYGGQESSTVLEGRRNSQLKGPPPGTCNIGPIASVIQTHYCQVPTCPSANTPYGIIVSSSGGAGSFCDNTVYPGCQVTSSPYTVISGTAGQSFSGYDINYTGAVCNVNQPAPTPTQTATATVDGQTFKMTKGTFSVVKWVNTGKDVQSLVTDTNQSSADDDNSIVRQSDSPADAPNNATPITVQFVKDGGRIVQVFSDGSLQDSTNLTNVRGQSGGPSGGNLAPGTQVTTSTTTSNGDGSTTTTTITYGPVTNTTTIINNPVSGSPTTTTTTASNPPGESASESEDNRGGPDNGGSPDGEDGGDCTSPPCDGDGEGNGGGDGAVTIPAGGTAREFTQSIQAVRTAFNGSALVSQINALQIPGGGTCPSPSISLPYLNTSITMDSHCTVAAGIRSELRAVFLGLWIIIAIGIFLRP